MSYNPSVGRWMQQDPAGYIDGANRYDFEKNNPVDSDDPTGLAVQIIEVSPTAAPATQPATQPLNPIDNYNQGLQQAIDAVNGLSDSDFQANIISGHIKINGKYWHYDKGAHTKKELTDILEHEKTSKYTVVTQGDLDALNKLASDAAKSRTQACDQTVVTVHGVYEKSTGKPLNQIVVNGQYYQQDTSLVTLKQSAKGNTTGNGLVISCFDNPQGNEEGLVQVPKTGLSLNVEGVNVRVDLTPIQFQQVNGGPAPVPATQPAH